MDVHLFPLIHLKMRPTIFFLLGVLSFATPTFGQELLELNLARHCQFAGQGQDEELYAFRTDVKVMQDLVAKILRLGGDLDQSFILIQTNVANVTAVVDGSRRYLLWSQDFLEKASPLEAHASVAHEIGHHVNGHTLLPERSEIEEAEADRFLGFVLSRVGFGPGQVRELFTDGGLLATSGPPKKRLAAVQQGQRNSEIALEINSLQFENDPSLENFLQAKFPFPPPPCYQQTDLPAQTFSGCTTLGQVAQRLRQTLDQQQYPFRYLSAKDGFVIVTQLEQYQSNGRPLSNASRWREVPPSPNFAFCMDYIRSLFLPQRAYLRLFAFVVSRENFSATGARIGKEEAKAWFEQAVNRLPKTVANRPFTTDYSVDVLVYEFEVPETNHRAAQKCPCHLLAGEHLAKSGLGVPLGKQ